MCKVPSRSQLKWFKVILEKSTWKSLSVSVSLSFAIRLSLTLSFNLVHHCTSVKWKVHHSHVNFNPPGLIMQIFLGCLFLRNSKPEACSLFQYAKWIIMDIDTAVASQWQIGPKNILLLHQETVHGEYLSWKQGFSWADEDKKDKLPGLCWVASALKWEYYQDSG